MQSKGEAERRTAKAKQKITNYKGEIKLQITDDPLRDADRYDMECQEWLNSLPHCIDCGEPLLRYGYVLEDEMYCPNCLLRTCRVVISDA